MSFGRHWIPKEQIRRKCGGGDRGADKKKSAQRRKIRILILWGHWEAVAREGMVNTTRGSGLLHYSWIEHGNDSEDEYGYIGIGTGLGTIDWTVQSNAFLLSRTSMMQQSPFFPRARVMGDSELGVEGMEIWRIRQGLCFDDQWYFFWRLETRTKPITQRVGKGWEEERRL